MQNNLFYAGFMSVLLATSAFTVSTRAYAAEDAVKKEVNILMTSQPGTEKFEDTVLLSSRTLSLDGKSSDLKVISHGLRKKAIFGLVPVRVYVTQLLASKPEKLIRTETGFLGSLKAANPVQLHLTFLRDLPGRKVAESFKEGLEANKISVKKLTPELSQVLDQVTAVDEFKKGQSFSITALWMGSQGSIVLEDDQKIKMIAGSDEFIEQIFSIWFGKPADPKLNDLRKELFK